MRKQTRKGDSMEKIRYIIGKIIAHYAYKVVLRQVDGTKRDDRLWEQWNRTRSDIGRKWGYWA